ncbi:hypothetical protein [Streptomyces sp. NPDC088794]|uniref:hypothetical protein n=1 Tax=Streptomyces sp. NPDC088794 TaxID=3365902 RepID=UPI00381D31C9
MEQRIGSSSQPLEGAGFDPAFIPGLTSPVSDEPAKAKEPDEAEDAAAEQPGTDNEADTEAEAEADAGSDDDADGEDAEESVDGPVFEASDRRARIVADEKGVRLSLDDQQCEFRWDEIGAVETETPRFGKRFTITVHTPERRWYPIEIEAASRARFGEWEEQLDAVLDAYFEEGDAEDEVEVEGQAEDEAQTEVEAATEAEDKDEAATEAEADAVSKTDVKSPAKDVD